MITLICGDQEKKVTIKQAESILHIQKEMKLAGWELSKDCPYEYKENALIKRANKRNCKKSEKAGSADEGQKPRTETKVSRGDDTSEA